MLAMLVFMNPGAQAAEAMGEARIDWFELTPTERFDPFAAPDFGRALGPVKVEAPRPRVVAPPPKLVVPPRPVEPKTAQEKRVEKKPVPHQVLPKEPVVDEEEEAYCGEDAALEVMAVLGKLDEGVRDCLQVEVTDAPKMVQRIHASKVLALDSYARGDRETWARQVGHHLEHLDRSDPELCMRYAQHMAKVGRAYEAIRWADTALENRSVWTAATHVERVESLYELRARAAMQIWEQADRVATASPGRANDDARDLARGRAKELSRAWLDYARAAERPTERALALCTAAAGTQTYCQ